MIIVKDKISNQELKQMSTRCSMVLSRRSWILSEILWWLTHLCRLLRVREALIDYFVYDNEYQSTDQFWQEYFYGFNYAAALARGK